MNCYTKFLKENKLKFEYENYRIIISLKYYNIINK